MSLKINQINDEEDDIQIDDHVIVEKLFDERTRITKVAKDA